MTRTDYLIAYNMRRVYLSIAKEGSTVYSTDDVLYRRMQERMKGRIYALNLIMRYYQRLLENQYDIITMKSERDESEIKDAQDDEKEVGEK